MTNLPGAPIDPFAVARAIDGDASTLDPQPEGELDHADPGPSELTLGADGADAGVVAACAEFDHSDTDNARRLIAHFGADLAVVAQEGVDGGDWAVWEGRYWDIASGAARAARIAQRIGGRIALEAEFLQHTPGERSAIDRAKNLADDDESLAARIARTQATAAKKALAARRGSRWRFAVTSKNVGRMRAMRDAAAPHLRRPADAFNADPYAIACASHTLRFARDVANPDADGDPARDLWRCLPAPGHARSDYISAFIPAEWRAGAQAARWRAFLERMLPDADVRRTVQAYCGASLINTPLQRLMFHYGLGANGKSVFLETLTRVMGDSFAIGLPPESIVGRSQRGAGAASPDIARLFGKRFVRVLEMPEGKPLHEDMVKRLTGGEKFPVRNLFNGYFEFVNRAKAHMSGNGFPTIDGTDHGIWRRMLVVHWGQTIPESERRDFDVVVGEFVAESAGILAWLVEGALDFLNFGLFVAPAIHAATEAYRADMDPIGEFFAECVRRTEGQTTGASALYQAYVSWSMANAKRPRSLTKFGKEAGKRFTREKRGDSNVYLDCETHNVPARPDAPAPTYPEGYA